MIAVDQRGGQAEVFPSASFAAEYGTGRSVC